MATVLIGLRDIVGINILPTMLLMFMATVK